MQGYTGLQTQSLVEYLQGFKLKNLENTYRASNLKLFRIHAGLQTQNWREYIWGFNLNFEE